jgi:hypothetical protein
MIWMHEHRDRLPGMGRRGQQLAAAYSASLWAERWHQMFMELVPEPPPACELDLQQAT